MTLYMCSSCGRIFKNVDSDQQCVRCSRKGLLNIKGRFDMRAVAGNVSKNERL